MLYGGHFLPLSILDWSRHVCKSRNLPIGKANFLVAAMHLGKGSQTHRRYVGVELGLYGTYGFAHDLYVSDDSPGRSC